MKPRRAIGQTEREAIGRAWNNQCAYCETHKGPFDVDHIVPYSTGGPCSLDNLCLACKSCNQRKRAARLPKLYEGLLLTLAKQKADWVSKRISVRRSFDGYRGRAKTPAEAVFGKDYASKYMDFKCRSKGITSPVTQEQLNAYNWQVTQAAYGRSKQEAAA
jgi:hypothetical protein